MRIFGIVGQSLETTVISGDYTPASDEIEMIAARPSSMHVAQVDGTWGFPEPTPAEITAQRIAEIDARLTAIDLASVRALRAAVAGTATEADRDQLAVWEAEAAALRSERSGLTAS